MKVYLCGPIHGCSDADSKGWRQAVAAQLDDVLDPMARDYRGKENANIASIVEMDKADIDRSDAVLAFVPRPSVGTSMEILYAWEREKPIICVVPGGPVSPWLTYHAIIVHSFADALPLLR